MSDDRLLALLGSLAQERVGRAADARIRRRLEVEWPLARHGSALGAIARLLPAAAIALLLVVAGAGTLRAGGDSPLYAVRVAIEDAAAVLYADAQTRAAYLLALYEERQAEAARLEAVGSAASGGARAIERRTLQRLLEVLPPAGGEAAVTETPTPSPSSTASPSPTPSPSPSPQPTPTAAPSATPRPTASPSPAPLRATPLPTSTAKPSHTLTPKPSPTASPVAFTLTGRVDDPSGAPASGACVSTAGGRCDVRTAADGTYRLVHVAKVGQTVTVYAWRTSETGAITHKGTASVVVRGSVVQVPAILLHQ